MSRTFAMSPAKTRKPSSRTRPAAKKTSRSKPSRKTALRRVLAPERTRPAENPRAKALAQQLAAAVLDKKAADVLILDVRGMTSYADYFVLASGESERQVAAMAENCVVKLKEQGEHPIGSEGMETGRWVLIDYGEVVAHLFFQDVRAFYDLEGLWADAPREQVA
jgi:ribosome-associated protein